MSETWRPVVGWDGTYEVSDLGRVSKSLIHLVQTGQIWKHVA